MPQLIQTLIDTGNLGTVQEGVKKAVTMFPGADAEELALKVNNELNLYRVVANHRANGRAGMCSRNKKIIELHGKLFATGREGARDSTLLHEVAHAITYVLAPRAKGHGQEWKFIMRCLGRKPSRTINTADFDYSFLSEAREKAAKLMYACQKCEFEFPAQRKKKHPADSYSHRGCGGRLYLRDNKVTHQTFPNPSNKLAA